MYLYIIMIAQWPPGPPGISTPFRVFEELFNESINFFYINIFFHWAGLPGLTSHAVRWFRAHCVPSHARTCCSAQAWLSCRLHLVEAACQ